MAIEFFVWFDYIYLVLNHFQRYLTLQFTLNVLHSAGEVEGRLGVGNDVLWAPSLLVYDTMEGCSSEQQHSSQRNIMHDDFQRKLFEMEGTLMSNDTDFFLENIFSEGSYNASEQITGSSPASEASSCGSQMEFSPSLVSRPGSRSSRGLSFSDPQMCPVCLSKPRDMALGCGHQTCSECGEKLPDCPICRSPIDIRVKLN